MKTALKLQEERNLTIYRADLLSTYQVIFCFGHIRVIRTQFCLVDLKGSLIIIFHFFVLALVLAQ